MTRLIIDLRSKASDANVGITKKSLDRSKSNRVLVHNVFYFLRHIKEVITSLLEDNTNRGTVHNTGFHGISCYQIKEINAWKPKVMLHQNYYLVEVFFFLFGVITTHRCKDRKEDVMSEYLLFHCFKFDG